MINIRMHISAEFDPSLSISWNSILSSPATLSILYDDLLVALGESISSNIWTVPKSLGYQRSKGGKGNEITAIGIYEFVYYNYIITSAPCLKVHLSV